MAVMLSFVIFYTDNIIAILFHSKFESLRVHDDDDLAFDVSGVVLWCYGTVLIAANILNLRPK